MTTDNTNTTRNDSLAARTDTWLQSFLVWSPGQRDIIKTVALVLMVLDHINLIFQLKQEWMFLAGRGAFPLFALVWGLNLSRHAHIRQPAINRLWGWGIIAQFAYYLAGFPWYEGNILFAFAVAAQVLTWCETRSGWRTAAAILLMALWGPLSGTSYGIAGLLMLAVSHRLYRAEDRAERLALVACLLAVIPALNLATSDAAAVAGLVMTVLTVGLVSCAGKSLPRFWPGDFFPVFRKTIINVTTPPKWKVKKQKLAEKAAREAELAAKKAQARQALSIYLNLPTLDEAVNTLKPWWPGLFDGDTPRLLACGIRDVLLEDVAQRNIPLSHKKLRRALKAITRSESYLCAMKAGACRYDTEGYVTEHISQEEEAYAAARLDKIRRQNRIKAELQAVLDEK